MPTSSARSISRALCVLLACTCCAVGAPAEAAPAGWGSASASTPFIAEALRQKLPNALAWRRLLHYRTPWLGDAQSEIDGKTFFLSPVGQSDPGAELIATLNAFFEPVKPGREDEHARCRFPARYSVLDARLGLTGRAPEPHCEKLARFLARVTPRRASLVYAANSLEYPASAFGHTFLYLDSGESAATGVGVDYQADTDTNNPILYAFKGLTGLFEGKFRIEPVASKLYEYADEEDRDLWLFDLALSRAELALLARHLWELSATHIDYFYLTENCSYHVLGALEAAAPRLPLTARLKFVVLPMDTVKAVFRTQGLVEGVRYVPSRSSRLRAQRRGDAEPDIPWHKSPERGHGAMRLSFGAGASSLHADVFASAGYRLALHDLLDPPNGQPELAQVQFLDTQLRYSVTRRSLTLEKLTFAELIALHPYGADDRRLSWRARAYGTRLRDRRCPDRDCFAHGLNAALGLAEADASEAFTVFLMADSFVLFSGALSGIGGSFVSAGFGPHAGARVRFSNRTVAVVTGTWSYLPAHELHATYELGARLRALVANDFALGVESALTPGAFEASLLSFLYF